MSCLGKLFDLDPDAGEDVSVNAIKAKYRKRAPSYDPAPDQKPAKKQKTVKNSYVAAAVAEDELTNRNDDKAISIPGHYFSIYTPIRFVSGGIQYQKTVGEVEASPSYFKLV